MHGYIYTFNDHYLNPLLNNLPKEANETIVLLGDFNNDILNFDTSEYVSIYFSGWSSIEFITTPDSSTYQNI